MGTYETLCLQQITETKISPIFFLADVVIYTEDFPDDPLESAASAQKRTTSSISCMALRSRQISCTSLTS